LRGFLFGAIGCLRQPPAAAGIPLRST